MRINIGSPNNAIVQILDRVISFLRETTFISCSLKIPFFPPVACYKHESSSKYAIPK